MQAEKDGVRGGPGRLDVPVLFEKHPRFEDPAGRVRDGVSQRLRVVPGLQGVRPEPAVRLLQLQRELDVPDGFLAGRLKSDWAEAVPWCCLTGSAQMSILWLKLYRLTGEARYREAGRRINRYLKATQDLASDNEGIRGGIAGPYPIGTGYNRYQMLNWAAKFFADALLLEETLGEES
jgi:hypothetical protein